MYSTPHTSCPRRTGFTLVELIVVITVLAILGTIAFLSFDKYTTSSRDSVRTEDMTNIKKGIEAYEAGHGKYPMPDNAITINNNGNPIRYQGYAGKSVLSQIRFSNGGTDPLDGVYYTYATNNLQTKYEILGYLEDPNSISIATYDPLAIYADASNYSQRIALIMGHPLGILVQSGTLVPAQAAGTTIDVATTTTPYVALVTRSVSFGGTGSALSVMTGGVVATSTSGPCTGIAAGGQYANGGTGYTITGGTIGTSLTANYVSATPVTNTCQYTCPSGYSVNTTLNRCEQQIFTDNNVSIGGDNYSVGVRWYKCPTNTFITSVSAAHVNLSSYSSNYIYGLDISPYSGNAKQAIAAVSSTTTHSNWYNYPNSYNPPLYTNTTTTIDGVAIHAGSWGNGNYTESVGSSNGWWWNLAGWEYMSSTSAGGSYVYYYTSGSGS